MAYPNSYYKNDLVGPIIQQLTNGEGEKVWGVREKTICSDSNPIASFYFISLYFLN